MAVAMFFWFFVAANQKVCGHVRANSCATQLTQLSHFYMAMEEDHWHDIDPDDTDLHNAIMASFQSDEEDDTHQMVASSPAPLQLPASSARSSDISAILQETERAFAESEAADRAKDELAAQEASKRESEQRIEDANKDLVLRRAQIAASWANRFR